MTREPGAEWLTARQASERLGVKLTTLYAYTSRGLITSLPGAGQRAGLYASDDVERLRTRHAARSGHGPVAAAALRFGEPVLETSISDVTPEGPRYRGYLATDLCRAEVSFESVAELLWTGALPAAAAAAAAAANANVDANVVPALPLTCDATQLWPLLKGRATLPKMALILAALALSDEQRQGAPDAAEHARARSLIHWLAHAPALQPPRDERPTCRVAETLLDALGTPKTSVRVALVDRALVLCAEHELNASAFAARVAASAGADLYACLSAALHTLSGSAHGGQCDRVEALIASVGPIANQPPSPVRSATHTPDATRTANVSRTVTEWLTRGEQIPGFGHPLYPEGDPRGQVLIELARAHGASSEPAKAALALLEVIEREGHPAPTLDAGLVTLCLCLELPAGSAATIFALGRSAGWVAHALEQRAAGYLLRPRARYVGGSPGA